MKTPPTRKKKVKIGDWVQVPVLGIEVRIVSDSNCFCKHCGRTQDGHCGHQYWCYDNYHSKKPTKFTLPKREE